MENISRNYTVDGVQLTYQMPKEVDHHIAKEMCQEIDRLIEAYGITELILDFAGTEFMDSSGIGVVIGRSKSMRFRNGNIAATGIGTRVDKILRSAGIYQLLQVK